MPENSRPCCVCHGANRTVLYSQRFSVLSASSLMKGYDLALCKNCGFAYADNIPEQAVFDRYYAEMSKYEYADRAGVQTESDLGRFREVADLVVPYLPKELRLLDIGCATGGLLAEFKRRGYANLFGVDPSPACVRLTEKLYGIPGKALTLSTLNQLGEPADVAFLTGVLEHIRDVDASLNSIKSCLRPGGFLYFEVPDATRYDHHFSAPFQFFSMEHVNFFSPVSLSNLLARHGFSVVFTKRLIRHLSPQAIEPAIGGLFRREAAGQKPPGLVPDGETEPALNRYLRQSRDLERKIQATLAALAGSAQPLAVWGTGTHTLRLLETSPLARANIVAFIDSNVHYQGKRLHGVPILPPDQFHRPDAVVLISSQVAETEIKNLIQDKLKWPNPVVCLYENTPGTTP